MAAQKESSSWWIGFLVIVFVLGDFAAAQPEPFLVAWWKFDDGVGDIATDSAGINHAMVEGPVWTTGVINGALAFSDGCVRPGFSPVLDELAVHDFTIAMWISTINAGQSVLIGNYMDPSSPSWNFEIFYGGVLRLYLDGEDHVDDASVADGNWHHVTALRVGQEVKLYIDGQESYSGFSEKEPYMVTNPTLIGRDHREPPLSFGGVMDDVRIYEAALTPEQIKRLAGVATWPSPTDGAGMISVDAQLSWTAGVGALSHDVWLGTDNPPTTLIANDILDTNCVPDTLDCSTVYYWSVDENTAIGTIPGDVWSFTTIDGKATTPQPANGASGVSPDTDLRWTAGVCTLTNDVYFGTDNPPTALIADDIIDTNCVPGPLDCATVYYWSVDENTSGGTITGDVWSFTTIDGKATAPQPVNGTSDVSVDTDLSWTAGACALSHDVWFGTDSPPTTLIADDILDATCDPGTLDCATLYYWQVDENTAAGTITGVVWSFRTEVWDIWVDDDYTAGGENDGHTWGIDAFDNIGAGIDIAEYGKTVHVAAGTYMENITLKNGVALIGAGADVTIMDGSGSGSVVISAGCDPNTILDGFTLTNGNASNGGGMYNENGSPVIANCIFSGNFAASGGGIYNNSADVRITNCVFQDNLTKDGANGSTGQNGGGGGSGAGMYNNHSSVLLTDCLFQNNSCGNGGNGGSVSAGGMAGSGGHGGSGGGMYNYYCSPVVTHCYFKHNTSGNGGNGGPDGYYPQYAKGGNGGSGGAIFNRTSSAILANCVFYMNSSGSGGAGGDGFDADSDENGAEGTVGGSGGVGGAVYNYNCSPTLANCMFTGNSTGSGGDGGGGGYSSSNRMGADGGDAGNGGSGGSIYNNNSPGIISNCTFAANKTGSGGIAGHAGDADHSDGNPGSGGHGGGICNSNNSDLIVTNCILWSNNAAGSGDEVYNSSSDPNFSYSDIKGCGGSSTGWNLSLGTDDGGNIDMDPLLAGDLHPKSEFGRATTDPSMPYGSWLVDTVTSPCINAGDPNMYVGNEPEGNGGRINMGTYGGTYQASKSSYVGPIEGDVNGDGKVDFKDLAILAGNWLAGTEPEL